MRTIYHGSENIIRKPEFGKGKPYNDYGRGFYCTEEYDLACEWSVDINRDGYVNIYEIEDADLSILNLNIQNYTVLHWLSVLLKHRTFDYNSPLAEEAAEYITRNFSIDLAPYDIIIGYRADDSYFSFAQSFLNGGLSIESLSRSMHLGNLGLQYVLKSKAAFSSIKFIDAVKVDSNEWYSLKKVRDSNARNEFRKINAGKRTKGSLYMTDILDEEVKPDDPRIR